MQLIPGHKRASSDISIGSSEDEKLSQSPSTLEAVPEKNEEFGVPKSPTAEPEISNSIPNVPEPSTEEPAEESVSNMKPQDQEDENVVEIKPDVPSTPLHILESPEEMKNMGDKVGPAVDNVTVIKNMDAAVKDELTPENSIKQVDGPIAVPEEKPMPLTSPVKEQDKGETPSPENESPLKPRFQKKASGSGSAADNSSIDLNLSISSFINKSKEAGSISVQVRILIEGVLVYY